MISLPSFFLKREKRKRKYLVHDPILRLRREEGEFHLLIKELRNYPEQFKIYLRMSVEQFDALLAILEPHIKKKTTNFREPIDPGQRLFRHTHTAGGSAGQTEPNSWILSFACTVALNCQTPFKIQAVDAKNAENRKEKVKCDVQRYVFLSIGLMIQFPVSSCGKITHLYYTVFYCRCSPRLGFESS